MDIDEMDENPSYTLKGSSETLLPIQLFEFKAHLLEAVEELRMGRLAKIQYEEQINKILMEKQELMWKYESLSNQEEIVEKQHNDSLGVLKKQLQAKMCLIEEEKGRFQLTAETKERENISLREDIKTLQIAKYNFQKKTHEMNVNENWLTVHSAPESEEQKLQLHILAKEDHIKQLSECKKCIGNVTQQFGMIKEVHEKLEQTVQIAIQNNKKLNIEINQKKNEIEQLKEELKKLSSEFLNYKVTYQQRADDENIILSEKEQHVRELKERLQMETEINKKLMEVNTSMKEEKQEDMKALSNMQTLVQRHTQTNISLENQLFALQEDYKTLERDNELQRAKATENEEKFLALQSEHKQAFKEWKAQKENLNVECDTVKKELETIKEFNNNLQKCNSKSLNKTPETIIQAKEQQSSMDIIMCDIENNTSENRTQNDPAANTTTSYVGSSNDVSLPVTSNEIQKMDGNKVDIVHKDTNSLQNVYNITDKGHLIEEQKDESALAENKAGFSMVEQNIRESWDGKCTEEIPDDRPCLNVVYEESAAKHSATIQTQATAEPIKMLADNNKPSSVCSDDASQQTDSSRCKSEDGTSEEVYIVIDKPDRADNVKGVLINETCSKESQLLDRTIGQSINEQGITGDISETGNRCTLGNGRNYHLPVLNMDTSQISTKSCSHDQFQQSEAEPMQPTNENPHGVCADCRLPEQTGRVDPKSVESKHTAKHCMDMETTLNTSVIRIEGAEMNSKCLVQETFTVSYSSQGPVENSSLQSALDLKYKDCNVESLQYTENTDVLKIDNLYTNGRESCPMNFRNDANAEETIECDVNAKSKLHSDNYCQQTDETSDPVNVDDEKVCIQENNVALGCMSNIAGSRLSDGKSCAQSASMKEENSKPNSKSPINLSTLAKFVYLPGSNMRDSLNISLNNQTNHTLPKLSGQDVHSRAEQVPRNDHSAEWNADQAIHNSSSPKLANSSENSDVAKKPNLCPAITNATGSYLLNLPNNTHTVVTCSNKDNYDISSIQRQISAIERFLFNNKLHGSRKRKLEDTRLAEE